MEATLKLNSANARKSLDSIAKPKNEILARLKGYVSGNKKEDNYVCGYSRMHNRHNRS